MNEFSQSCYPITTIVSHEDDHLDEEATKILVRDYGHEFFTGVKEARHEVFDPSVHDIENYPDEDWWLKKGYLFIGVGRAGWRFVDHPHKDHPDDCAFTMMLKFLGLYKDPAWNQVGLEVLREDLNGAPSRLHLAALIKAAREYMNLEEAKDAIVGAVEFFLFGAFYRKQVAFQMMLKELDSPKCCKTVEVTNRHTGEKHKLAVVKSDSSEAAAAARFRGAKLVVHLQDWEKDTQRVYISTAKKEGVRDLRWLAAHLRWAEQKAMVDELGCEWQSFSDEEIAADGMLFRWYHHQRAAAIFNRSKTAKHVPRTLLSLQRIVNIAKAYLHETESIRPPKPRNNGKGGRRK